MVGHHPIIVIGATIIVFNHNKELLLNLRSDTGTWGIPGGAMEPGEAIEETARRELYEETGLKAIKLKLLDVLSGPEYFFVYPNGDQIHTVIVLYQALSSTCELKINDGESKCLKYFSTNSLPKLESRAENVIRHLKARKLI